MDVETTPRTPRPGHNERCRTRAIEQRAAGVTGRMDRARHVMVVPSRTTTRSYDVAVSGVGALARVSCTCEAGRTQPPLGSTPCWHGALVLLAMEDARLVTFDGDVWRLTHPGVQTGDRTPIAKATADEVRRRSFLHPPKHGTPEYQRMVSALVD